MVRLYFYVEGQTEQVYVTRVLMPHLAGFGVQGMGAAAAFRLVEEEPQREDLPGRVVSESAV